MEDIRLLLAILAPLIGAGLVMATGKRPNVRETCSFVAAATLFGITASLIPAVHAGTKLHFTLFQLLPGLSVSLRADALSMVFAVAASFLWMVTVFYSAGYMRGLKEHEQTRFNTCFALALFGAIGCAFSDNLLTLYLFYEIVSICTYPLVAHHQDEESYESGKKYLTYLTGAAKGLILPAMVLIYVLSGTLDFADNIHTGIIPPGVHHGWSSPFMPAASWASPRTRVMPLHNWLPSAMVAPTPGQRAAARGRGGQGRRVLDRAGDALCLRHGHDGRPEPGAADGLLRLDHDRGRLDRGPEQGQPESAAGLLDGQPACPTSSWAWPC